MENNYNTQEKSTKITMSIIMIGVLFIATIALLAFLFLKPKNSPQNPQNTAIPQEESVVTTTFSEFRYQIPDTDMNLTFDVPDNMTPITCVYYDDEKTVPITVGIDISSLINSKLVGCDDSMGSPGILIDTALGAGSVETLVEQLQSDSSATTSEPQQVTIAGTQYTTIQVFYEGSEIGNSYYFTQLQDTNDILIFGAITAERTDPSNNQAINYIALLSKMLENLAFKN